MSLPVFAFTAVHQAPLADGIAQEAAWLASCAATGRAIAHLWHAPPGMIVPRGTTQRRGWVAVAAAHAAQVRASGGGPVPQGPGVWNLSLVWPAAGVQPAQTQAIYEALCGELGAAFARLGVHATPQAVADSFCDGRFNLAAGGRKLVGTAQSWRRIGGRQMVLAHAVILVSADVGALTERANAFEAATGSGRRYRAEAHTTLALAAGAAATPAFEQRAIAVIAEQFAHVVAPHRHEPPDVR